MFHKYKKEGKKINKEIKEFAQRLDLKELKGQQDVGLFKDETKQNKYIQQRIIERIPNTKKQIDENNKEDIQQLKAKIQEATKIRDKLVHIILEDELSKRSQQYRQYYKDKVGTQYDKIEPRIHAVKLYPQKIQKKLDRKQRKIQEKQIKKDKKKEDDLLNKLIQFTRSE